MALTAWLASGAISTPAAVSGGQPAPPAFVRVDDMAFDADTLQWSTDRGDFRTQAFPAFLAYSSVPYDFGVVPVDLPDDISAERAQRFWDSANEWSRAVPIVFVPRTTQSTYVAVTTTQASCYSMVGAGRTAGPRPFSMNSACWAKSQVVHEIGHALGLAHEHQRPDRDDYIAIDESNIVPEYRYALLDKLRSNIALGPYDFRSVMHYPDRAFAVTSTRPNIIPHPPYAAYASIMGRTDVPSSGDHGDVTTQYARLLQPSGAGRPTQPVRTSFPRSEFLQAMERLHALYMSRLGLNRPQGLSIDGKPDFLGLAQWIFDIYLGARSGGFDPTSAFDIVIAAVTQTDEWRARHPGQQSLSPAPFSPYVRFDRDEFLDTLRRLDAFYASAEGLQRPNGLSIAGGPDFLGIATWIFDIYLSERVRGTSPTAAWIIVQNAIRATDEWKRRH